MQAALKLTARVLPGKRIEVTAPQLNEGEEVELIVVLPTYENVALIPVTSGKFKNIIEFLDSLTPIQRTPEEWAETEREIAEERAAWDC